MDIRELYRVNYFEELKKRSVYRVAVAYLVVAWGVVEVSAILVPVLDLSGWTMKFVLIVLVLGFLTALIAAWVFEVTPDGLKFQRDIDESTPRDPRKGRGLDLFIIGMLLLIIVGLVVERVYFAGSEPEIATLIGEDTGRSVAVLPFDDLSQAQDQEWFADGLAEEILNALARTPDILVSSRTSSFAYKGTEKDLRTIAGELGVAYVLEGSIRATTDRVRVTAQLIRASDDFHMWSQTYDRDAADVIEIQEDVAVRIASALETTLDPNALQEMMSVGTRSVRAYQAYVRGLAMRTRANRTNDWNYALEAYDQFEVSRNTDPKFSLAHREAALFWAQQMNPSIRGSGLIEASPAEMMTNFMERIDLAIDSAANEADRSGSRALRASVQLRLRNSMRRYREYLAERPNDIRAWYDLLVVAQKSVDRETIDEALAVLRDASETDRFATAAYLSNAYRLGDASDTADFGLARLERWPNDAAIAYQTHRSLLWAGRIDEARELLQLMDPSVSRNLMIQARQACADGRRENVLEILDRMRAFDQRRPLEEWLVMKMLGEHDEARLLLIDFAGSREPYQVAAWLVFPSFDPADAPGVTQMLVRENVDRPAPVDIPFACPAS